MGTRTRATLVVTGALIVGLGWPLFQFATQTEGGRLVAAQAPGGQLRTGKFAGPVIGLKYETPTVSGVTDEKGQFQCRDGEDMTFFLGNINLGSWKCSDRITLAHLDFQIGGVLEEMNGFRLTNRARLLQSLDQDGVVENGVTLTPKIHEIVGGRPIDFARTEEQFTEAGKAGDIHQLLGELDDAGVWTSGTGLWAAGRPRWLRSAAVTRNELRRNIRGFIKMRDVKIPMRDGSFLYADVIRPDDNEKHPVVMTFSIYGKESHRGCVCNVTDYEHHEEIEDEYFSGNPHNDQYENHESANTVDWVPYGYAVMRVDGRGSCNNAGEQYPFSYQEAKDYYDSIEWAGTQPWSSGNVGLWGASYTGWDMPPVASLQPPHLKAMIPVSSDHKYTEDVIYVGGLYNEGFIHGWWNGGAREVCTDSRARGVAKGVDLDREARRQQPFFYDAALHGPTGSLWMDPDMSKVVVPQWTEMPTIHTGNIHQRGTSEQFFRSATPLKDKKLILAPRSWMADAYIRVAEHRAFFDYYLKGVKNNIPNIPPVRLFIATGNGAGYYQYAENWPVPGTNYTKFYLDATPSTWAGDGMRNDFLRLSTTPPTAEKSKSYSAQADTGRNYPPRGGPQPCWAPGISFVSDPVPNDLVLAGHMKLAVWASSTSSDMDVQASFRVMDENNRWVNFAGLGGSAEYPLFWGAQRAGYRKLDPKWSTDWRPIYSLLKADYKPLTKAEVIETQVELWANALRVKKGQRMRLDVQPVTGCGRARLYYDPSYHDGAQNTVYTGPKRLSYLQLPVISGAAAAAPTAAAAR